MFFLIVNCLSACFDGSTALSAGCGCNIKPARGTGNFDLHFVRSGNRRKFTSMFKCASLALPCASVAGCQTKFQVPLTALKMHPYFGEPGSYHVKHWKDCFDNRKKNMCFRTAAFHIKNNLPCIPGTIFKILYFLQSPPQTT